MRNFKGGINVILLQSNGLLLSLTDCTLSTGESENQHQNEAKFHTESFNDKTGFLKY